MLGGCDQKPEERKAEKITENVLKGVMGKDVPQFTAGRIEHVTKTREGDTQSFNIFFADIRGDALKEYDAELKEKGWQTQLLDMGKAGMISAQKDKLGLSLSSSQDDNKGTLAVFSTP